MSAFDPKRTFAQLQPTDLRSAEFTLEFRLQRSPARTFAYLRLQHATRDPYQRDCARAYASPVALAAEDSGPTTFTDGSTAPIRCRFLLLGQQRRGKAVGCAQRRRLCCLSNPVAYSSLLQHVQYPGAEHNHSQHNECGDKIPSQLAK